MSDNVEAVRELEWLVSASPHTRAPETTGRIMWSVVAALAPAAAWSVYVFGAAALYVIFMCVAACVVTEYVCNRLRNRPPTVSDGSAVVTGLLLAMILPSHTVVTSGPQPELAWLSWQVPVVGSVVAIAIAKHCFGGLGHNIWNPALIGRAFVQLSFTSQVSPASWPWPRGGVDAVTQATSLSKTSEAFISVKHLFFGVCPGSLGEVSAFLLLLGAAYLVIRKHVDWRLPLSYFLTVLLFATLFATLFAWAPADTGMVGWVKQFARDFQALRGGELGLDKFGMSWLGFSARQLFSGGVMLGALYMATDMVTSPLSCRGQVYFGIGCGLLTALIRAFSGMPEGVCYAILLMNTVRPYIDRISRQRILGETRKQAKA